MINHLNLLFIFFEFTKNKKHKKVNKQYINHFWRHNIYEGLNY